METTIAFGLSFATLLTLLVVPSLYLIGNDARRFVRFLKTGRWPAPEEVLSYGQRQALEEEQAPKTK